jgi:hypothetical protein
MKIYAFNILLRAFDIMATVTIEVNKDRDLPALEAFLKKWDLITSSRATTGGGGSSSKSD